MTKYNEVVSFIETNHRNPSKYVPEEKLMVHFLKRGQENAECRRVEGTKVGVV